MRILLAEDQAPTARIMRMALEKAGYSVTVKHNGKEALDAVLQDPPDALVTDIEMPIMTGQELCLTLADQMPDRTFPVYVVTSVTDMVHREWTKSIDNLFFLEKPVGIKRLASELEQRLGQ